MTTSLARLGTSLGLVSFVFVLAWLPPEACGGGAAELPSGPTREATAGNGLKGAQSAVTIFEQTLMSTGGGQVFRDGFESGGLSHTENGYAWGVGTGEGVTQGVGRGGGYGLEIRYPASADGDDSKPNLNLLFGTQPTEVWVEYWMKVPSNFNHRDQSTGATNNKFFQIWGGGTRTAEPKAILEYQRVDPVGTGDRAESFIRDGENGGALSSEVGDAANNPFIASSDHGNWIQVRWHFKIGDHGSSNSVLEMWKNGSLWHSDTAHDDLTSSDSSKNYFDHIRLFGWSNSGFDEETTFIIDDFRIHTSDPGWGALSSCRSTGGELAAAFMVESGGVAEFRPAANGLRDTGCRGEPS